MKILSITAGAAGMYCGSCLRDNALAAELMAKGHDVTLVPLYTPTLTDEANVSQPRVFFGGISVYLQQRSSFFRKSPRLFDKLWDSSIALKAASRRSIPVDPKLLGELTISVLQGEDGFHKKELVKLLDWLRSESPPPDVIVLPNSMLIALARPIREALKRPVLCTLQGEDLFIDGLYEPYRTRTLDLIRSNVEHVDAFLPVSRYYAAFMASYLGIPQSRLHVVPLGISLEGYGRPEARSSDQFKIGYFARVAPEKGLHVLIEAYRRLREQVGTGSIRLEAAGYLAPEHEQYLDGITAKMRDWGYGDEFRYVGVVDRQHKIEFLRSLDVLSVPATYDEPKGMFLLEAMAAGIPVVQPRRGAFTEIIETTGGGLLVEPENPELLAEALLSIKTDPALREQLSNNAYEGVRRHYSASQMADQALKAFNSVIDAVTARLPGKALSGIG